MSTGAEVQVISSSLSGARAMALDVVVQVTWSLAAGGSERYTLDVASGLDHKKYKPWICALDSGGPLELDAQERHIPYIVLNRRSGIHFGLMWELYRTFRATRAKIVHTHHFSPLFYSIIGAKLVGAQLIHTEHGLSTYKSRRLRFALRVLSRFCLAVVAVGTESERVLREDVGISPGKLCVIPGGVKIDRFVAVNRAEARAALGLKASERVAAIVARLSPEKNHSMLIGAFKTVLDKVANARLLIVGEGIETAAIAEQISSLGLNNYVRLLGVRHDIPQILAACDVFVLSSRREALPIAVLEAMAAGLPVIATNVGDLHTIVEDGVTGRLVPSENLSAFAEATAEILGSPELAQRMGAEARSRVANFSVQAMVERYERLYQRSDARSRH